MDQLDTSMMLDMSLEDIAKLRKQQQKTAAAAGKAAKKTKVAESKATLTATTPYTTEKRCSNCMKTGHLRKACPEPKMCNSCGKTDHERKDCPKISETCKKCGKVGHLQVRCMTKVDVAKAELVASATPSEICLVCGSNQHVTEACSHSHKTCGICKKVGHLRSMCPQNPASVGVLPTAVRAAMNVAVGRAILPSAPTTALKSCMVCGSVAHDKNNCPHKMQMCEHCGKQGHFTALCPKLQQRKV